MFLQAIAPRSALDTSRYHQARHAAVCPTPLTATVCLDCIELPGQLLKWFD